MESYVEAELPILFPKKYPTYRPLVKKRYLVQLSDGRLEVDYYYTSEKRWHKNDGKVVCYYEPARGEINL
jgi:hypothetical protein